MSIYARAVRCGWIDDGGTMYEHPGSGPEGSPVSRNLLHVIGDACFVDQAIAAVEVKDRDCVRSGG